MIRRSRPLGEFTACLTLILALGVSGAAAEGTPQDAGQALYRTLFLRAAPGHLATVLELFDERWPGWQSAAEAGPFRMRHSQGDQWDLMLIFHVPGPSAGGLPTDVGRADKEFTARLAPHLAWREELWVRGPSAGTVAARFADAGYFHVEVFLAVAGKQAELLEERNMENTYLEGIGRDPNLIFERVAGAAWDSYTIGFYRDIKHFAESADIPDDVEERAATAAGFESVSTIGTYLRSLIAQHHDTLATALR